LTTKPAGDKVAAKTSQWGCAPSPPTLGGRSCGECVARFNPDVVIDMICFAGASARQLAEALRWPIAHGEVNAPAL